MGADLKTTEYLPMPSFSMYFCICKPPVCNSGGILEGTKSRETAQSTLLFQLLLNFQNCIPNLLHIFMLPSQLITLPDSPLRQSQLLLVLLAQKLECRDGFVPGKRRHPNPECNGHALRTFSEQSMRGSELKNLQSYLHT